MRRGSGICPLVWNAIALTGIRPGASLRLYFKALGVSVRGICISRGIGFAGAVLSLAAVAVFKFVACYGIPQRAGGMNVRGCRAQARPLQRLPHLHRPDLARPDPMPSLSER